MPLVHTSLTIEPIRFDELPASDDETGAELVFHGRVRAGENGTHIVALDYEHYKGMAETQLQQLAEQTVEKFGLDGLTCIHRIGRVPVRDVAVRVVIHAGHRGEAIEALRWFIDELKQRVPIWKWAVDEDGNQSPSQGVARAEGGPGRP